MTTYNTGNPVGSAAAKDLYDNAENLDVLANDRTKESHPDRLGVDRKTWWGMEQDFQQFLINSGYQNIGDYGPGLEITARNQIFWRDGELYRAGAVLELPYTTTGDWGEEEGLFVAVGDQALRQDLSSAGGSQLIGYKGDTLETAVDALETAVTKTKTGTIVNGQLILDASLSGMYRVVLQEDVSDLVLIGAQPGKRASIEVAFVQEEVPKTVATPLNVRMPFGRSDIADPQTETITLARFVTDGDGEDWMYSRRGVYDAFSKQELPPLLDDNATFNDEGDSLTGWASINITPTTSNSWIRGTKVAEGSNSFLTKTINFTPSNADFIFYGKIRGKSAEGSPVGVWMQNATGNRSLAGVWLGRTADGQFTAGAVSFYGRVNNELQYIDVASGFDYQNKPVEFALQYDSKFGSLVFWLREDDGRWKFKGRASCGWLHQAVVELFAGTDAPAGAWVEADYLTLCKPNIVMLSDSIGEGKPSYSPNMSLNLSNDETTWMRHAVLYPNRRNNLIVNKGVGSQTSAAILSRVTDATSTGAKVVFLHSSTNDYGADVPQGVRATNIQNTINQLGSSGIETVLLNSIYGTEDGAQNTPPRNARNYYKESWDNYLVSLNGVSGFVDIMPAVMDSNGYLSSNMAADNVHPNVAGHKAIGERIKRIFGV